MAEVDSFHAHLDTCKQCAEQPFNLCAEGTKLIYATVRLLPVKNPGPFYGYPSKDPLECILCELGVPRRPA